MRSSAESTVRSVSSVRDLRGPDDANRLNGVGHRRGGESGGPCLEVVSVPGPHDAVVNRDSLDYRAATRNCRERCRLAKLLGGDVQIFHSPEKPAPKGSSTPAPIVHAALLS
jgi:hypothetical protein